MITLLAALAPPAGAIEVSRGNGAFFSDPVAACFAPVAISAFDDASCGLMRGQGLHLRFIAHTATANAERQAVLLLKSQVRSRTAPSLTFPLSEF